MISGEITFQAGDQILKAKDGFFVSIPRGTVHSFRVDSDVAHILNFYTPAGFEQTTIELGQPALTRTLPPPGIDKPVSLQQIKALFEKVGMHIVDSPDIAKCGVLACAECGVKTKGVKGFWLKSALSLSLYGGGYTLRL